MMHTRTATSKTRAVTSNDAANRRSGLQFDEPLSWRAGKAIPIADLLRRLQTLFKELQSMEQEEDERDSFTKIAKELASPNLLAHKDKGVKAWVGCCLVEVLRLCAPDAPYTGHQLKDIFSMMINAILPALSEPSNPYNHEHLHVLESLAQVKSVVLLTDIPSSETLTLNLFLLFFDISSNAGRTSKSEQLAKNVEFYMTSILEVMVEESNTLPTEVVDMIMAQFLRTDPRAFSGGAGKSRKHGVKPLLDEKQSTLMLKDLPPGYNMAKTICNTCSEKMARHVSQYFNDVIVDASGSSNIKHISKSRAQRRASDDMDVSDGDDPSGTTEEDLKELYKAHQLIRELWRASPQVLQNVIPQLEAELSAENVQLRLLATETLGDMISGIGAAGLPPAPKLDPSAYPTASHSDLAEVKPSANLLTKPCSPLQFPQAHPQAYSNFLGRKQDKSPLIRSAWTTSIGRILSTCAGGAGLSSAEEELLIENLANLMADADEKVRLAAVRVVGSFSYKDVVIRLGPSGSVTTPGSVLGTLAERVRDRKHTVRAEAMKVLGRIWGIAAGDVAAGEESVISSVGAAPTRILDAYYANDMEINALLDRVMYEQLLPMGFPPIKSKTSKNINSSSQQVNDSRPNLESETEAPDADKIRTERILTLVHNLDERSKKVFFAMQSRQVTLAKVMTAYLQRCEDYNAGVMDADEAKITEHLTRLIDAFSNLLPDPAKVTNDLWKFAKTHDRRSYQLIRYAMAPESDYRTVYKAMKEFTKRMESQNAPAGLLDTLTPLLYRVCAIVYNKSHVPAIMEYSRTNEKSLASVAHEILSEISTRTPEVLKAHVQAICKALQEGAPSKTKANDPGATINLKACASFASKFGKDMPHDRTFNNAMMSFALYGTPPESAKYAVSIILNVSDKKELTARDLVLECIREFEYGGDGFLARLATLSQLTLLAFNVVDEKIDAVKDIAINQILLQVRTPSTDSSNSSDWSESTDSEFEAKSWALKILVNRVRSHPTPKTLAEVASPVYQLLSTLITQHGEILQKKTTPSVHKRRLRLLAARSYLKLCAKKDHDALLSPLDFNDLAVVAQDSEIQVRQGFLQRLKKYLVQHRLSQRFYAIPFLLAFEPNEGLKSATATWIRSRAAYFSNLRSKSSNLSHNHNSNKASIVLESVFARLLSLLAHHPDYVSQGEGLVDFSRYLIFYLRTVATEENLSLIYHIAQRVKQCRDAVALPTRRQSLAEASHNESSSSLTTFDLNLYRLSDLAQLTIRKYLDANSWTLETLPAKIRLPTSLFTELRSHDEALEIAERNHLPEEIDEEVEALVKASMRTGKKRKSEGATDQEGSKKTKKTKVQLPIRRSGNSKEKPLSKSKSFKKANTNGHAKALSTPPKNHATTPASSERRRSGRVKAESSKNYAERESEEDDEEMEVLSWTYEDGSPPPPLPSDADADAGDGADEAQNGGSSPVESPGEKTKAKEPPKGKKTSRKKVHTIAAPARKTRNRKKAAADDNDDDDDDDDNDDNNDSSAPDREEAE